jgi:hypothetical protein
MQCEHMACTCIVDDGRGYCGPSCRQGVGAPDDPVCHCGHADCDASTGRG